MTGTIAQFVALTCHANAFLQGRQIPEFFPGNSTCQFCESVKFVTISKTLLGKAQEVAVAANPNAWFEHLRTQRTLGVRLSCTPQNQPGISDRMSSAFVGGGGTWAMEAVRDDGMAAVWLSRWEVWNQNAPERRIWRVTYGHVAETQAVPFQHPDLELVATRFRSALTDILAFSRKQKLDGFSACFARALETLESRGEKRHGYHSDLVAEGVTPQLATRLLDACQSAWVFGGMGSWNDMGFERAEQNEYDRVSDQLFTTINDTIQSATNAPCRKP